MGIQDDIKIIIKFGYDNNASDIHIEPQDQYFNIRARKNGLLELIYSNNNINNKININTKHSCQQIINALKIMAKLDISETRIPQDGRININNLNNNIPIRISTIPTQYGEKMVLRILNNNETLFEFKDLGLLPDQIKILNKNIFKQQGLILVTGPTGSGKTQLLYSILNKINIITKNIVTIENPIEKSIKNITQIQTEDQINLSFDKILKAILRQDPDVIMIGEIRDEKTAKTAIQASETGHLVLASLHTNGTAETINRLIHMGIPNYYIADCLSLIISCRLLKINNSRVGVYEVMQINNKIKKLIYQKATTQEIYDIASNISST